MRALVIVLAVFGALFLTSVAGCVGCVGCAIFLASKSVPEHFTREAIAEHHAESIAAARQALAEGRRRYDPAQALPEGLVAIFGEKGAGEIGSSVSNIDVYGRYQVSHSGHNLWNGVGAMWLTVDGRQMTCAAYTVTIDGADWVLALRDWQGSDPSSLEPAQ